jgi:hypothetical protein
MVPTIFHDIRQSGILFNSASMISKITWSLNLDPGCSEEAFVRKAGDFVNAFILRITRCYKHCVHSESITDFGPDVTFL